MKVNTKKLLEKKNAKTKKRSTSFDKVNFR